MKFIKYIKKKIGLNKMSKKDRDIFIKTLTLEE
ncbi:hypothetical protein JOC62_002969 [Clostridium sardiniense]|nr:hypothetical protein [Clostridium sardiniense]